MNTADDDVIMEDRTFYSDRQPMTTSPDPNNNDTATIPTNETLLSRQDTLNNFLPSRRLLSSSVNNADQGSSNGVGRVFPNFSKPLVNSSNNNHVVKNDEDDDDDGREEGEGSEARRTDSAGSNSVSLNHHHPHHHRSQREDHL